MTNYGNNQYKYAFDVKCVDSEGGEIDFLTQWDVRQSLVISDPQVVNLYKSSLEQNFGFYFHFANKLMQSSKDVGCQLEGDKLIVKIPDVMLQYSYNITVYLYVYSDEDSAKTLAEITIPVKSRPKPSGYDYTDDEEVLETYLEKVVARFIGDIDSLGVNPDHNQNDPTQPDYIKNRLAYRCRKFEDIESTEYPEPILGVIEIEEEGEVYTQPVLVKFSDLIEGTTSFEVLQEIIGLGFMGQEMRLDDPEMVSPELLQYLKWEKIFDENGQQIGAYFDVQGQPFVVITEVDNFKWNYVLSIDGGDEIYEESVLISIPEKGIYTAIMDSEEDDNGETVQYYTYDKILFRDVKTIDKDLLPLEALSPMIEIEDWIDPNSENPVTSERIYKALQNKVDKPYIYSGNEGYFFGVRNSTLQLIAPPSTGISETRFQQGLSEKMSTTDFTTYKSALNLEFSNLKSSLETGYNQFIQNNGVSLSRANQAFEFLSPAVMTQLTSEDEGKILVVKDKMIHLVKIPFAEEEVY